MDKERQAYEVLLLTINGRSTGLPLDVGLHEQQLSQLIHIQKAANDSQGWQVDNLKQLLEGAAAVDTELLKAWLVWLNELLLVKKLQLLGEPNELVEWLLQWKLVEQEHELSLLLSLLKIIPTEELKNYWTRLSQMSQPLSLEASRLLILCQDLAYSEEVTLNEQLADSLMQPHFEGRWLQSKCEELQAMQMAQTLQLLAKIVSQQTDYVEQHAPQLMGLCLAQLQFGVSGENKLPRRIQPAQQSAGHGQEEEEVVTANNRSGGRRNKARKMRSLTKQRQVQAEAATMGADRLLQLGHQDYGCRTGDSDTDQQQQQPPAQRQLQQLQAKVRISALQLMSVLTKQLTRRSLYGYWHVLFPSNESTVKHNLLSIGQLDGNPRCRALALQLAAQLFYGSKGYLSQASSKGPVNYTPFAVSLASSVLASYRALTSILEKEYVPPVLMQCLKCLAVLVQATPFEQLEMGFVYEFVPHVKKLTRHEDTPVAVCALLVMEMLVAAPRLTQEIACAVGLSKPTMVKLEPTGPELYDSEEEEQPEEEDEEKVLAPQSVPAIPRNSWLLRQILRYLDSPSTVPALRVECLQVLLAMATHFALLQQHLARLSQIIRASLMESSQDVRLYAARCLDALGYQMGRQSLSQEQHLNFWLTLLPSIYAAYTDSATSSLKCALCDALSNLDSTSFERLPLAQRNGLLAFLCGCSSDDAEEQLVRGAALRALAVYVLHPSLRADLVFIENAAELTLRLCGDTQLAVRIKAAWALGNISDALVAGLSNEHISDPLLSRLIEAASQSCSDHDKVRANAVRALGNLLQLLPGEGRPEMMERGLGKLLDCVRSAGSAKVKWNACYALGNLVKHRAIFSSSGNSSSLLFPCLAQLIVQHGNFKVRINATAVLLQVEQRSDFGTHFASVWRSLLAAIERSNALDNFEEYNHRDGLQQQLCLAMAHLMGCARPDDLPNCRLALEEHLDVVTATWRRVAYRIVAEQAAPLFTCSSLLAQRLHSTSGEQRSALGFIVEALRLES